LMEGVAWVRCEVAAGEGVGGGGWWGLGGGVGLVGVRYAWGCGCCVVYGGQVV